MPATDLKANALILYKQKPAIVQTIDKKVSVKLADGQTISVRPKDVVLLHPGPIQSLGALNKAEGDIETAWELLAGETTTLPELAELAFDEYTPATAWATWELLVDGLYFSGDIDTIQVHTAVSVEEIKAARKAKEAEEAQWQAFVERFEQNSFIPEDEPYLEDIVALANGERSNSRTLKNLGQTETPENAHAVLLNINYWDETVNPYPARMGVNLDLPDFALPQLPDEERRDLTHLAAYAIDDEGSTDADDALSWENGRFWIHIADVAALIPANSPADVEARNRGANLYLPETTITMLPESATDILALGREDISPALSLGLNVTPDGDVEQVEVVPSWIRVTKLSYSQANEMLDQAPFIDMVKITNGFKARRQVNGEINIDLPEVRIRLDEEGHINIRPILPLPSRNLVREAMLMAGEAVAQYALLHDIPIPFTSQGEPKRSVDTQETPSGMFARRRAMNRSQQTTKVDKHTGLGMEQYVQCTSPLRRYLDLVVHQQLRAHLTGAPLLEASEITERIGFVRAITGNLRRAERLSNKHWVLVYLQRRPQWQGEGVIIEKRGKRDLVLIPELELETEVYIQDDLPLDTAVTLQLTQIQLPLQESHFTAIT